MLQSYPHCSLQQIDEVVQMPTMHAKASSILRTVQGPAMAACLTN